MYFQETLVRTTTESVLVWREFIDNSWKLETNWLQFFFNVWARILNETENFMAWTVNIGNRLFPLSLEAVKKWRRDSNLRWACVNNGNVLASLCNWIISIINSLSLKSPCVEMIWFHLVEMQSFGPSNNLCLVHSAEYSIRFNILV